jgi:hypothetical protein
MAVTRIRNFFAALRFEKLRLPARQIRPKTLY